MWTAYKKEIVTKEKENKHFLKSFYKQNQKEHEQVFDHTEEDVGENGDDASSVVSDSVVINGVGAVHDDYSMPVVLESDEEGYVPPPSSSPPPPYEAKKETSTGGGGVKNPLGLFKFGGRKASKQTTQQQDQAKTLDDLKKDSALAAATVADDSSSHDDADSEDKGGTEVGEGEEQSPTTLEMFAADKADYSSTILPKWLYKYLVFRFNLLDRCGEF